jgi:hypothetical protein
LWVGRRGSPTGEPSTALHSLTRQSESESYITTNSQSASLSGNKAPIWGLRPDLCFCQAVAGLLVWGALPRGRVWPSPAQSFSSPSSVGLVTIFYCLRFKTSLFVALYDSQQNTFGRVISLRADLQKTLPASLFYCCVTSPCTRNLCALHSNGCCLQSHLLATGVYTTIRLYWSSENKFV